MTIVYVGSVIPSVVPEDWVVATAKSLGWRCVTSGQVAAGIGQPDWARYHEEWPRYRAFVEELEKEGNLVLAGRMRFREESVPWMKIKAAVLRVDPRVEDLAHSDWADMKSVRNPQERLGQVEEAYRADVRDLTPNRPVLWLTYRDSPEQCVLRATSFVLNSGL